MPTTSGAKKTASKKKSTRTTRTRKKTTADQEQISQNEASSAQQEHSGNTDSGQDTSDGLLGGLANKATRIVEQAASILEEEIAAGIVAARNVEERYVDIGNLRSGDQEKVMQRFRQDAHEVVDILLDLVNVSVNSLGSLTQRVVSIQSGPSGNKNKVGQSTDAASVPTLMIPGILKEGESGEISMSVENDSDQSTAEFTFKCTRLLSADEGSIEAENIHFKPELITVGPNTFEKVVVTVEVPGNTQPGVYSGLLQATKLSHIRALLTVVVEE